MKYLAPITMNTRSSLRAGMILSLLALTASLSYAQVNIEITPFGGWLWTSKVPVYVWDQPVYRQINVKVTDKVNYGVRLGVRADYSKVIEFEYNRTEAEIIVPGAETDSTGSFGFAANYYMLGGVYEGLQGDVVPYGILNVGLVNFKGKEGKQQSTNMFVAGLGAGIKYYLSEKVGLRLQGRFLLPMQFSGVGLGCSIGTGGSGCGVSGSGYSSVIQGDFTGGVLINIGE
jgi:hypothetical protein